MVSDDALVAAFWKRVERRTDDDCWPWTGTISQTGYGEMMHGARGNTIRWRAHRLSYFINKGELKDGLVVMHACDNRRCVNPGHLELGTYRDNIEDMMRKGRNRPWRSENTHCKWGHPFSPDNTYRHPTMGHRKCRICMRVQKLRRKNNG